MWIKAHFIASGDEIRIQTQNIAAVFTDQSNDPHNSGKTIIQFIGSEDNYIYVRETMDEIGEQILE